MQTLRFIRFVISKIDSKNPFFRTSIIDSIAEVMGGVRDDNGWDRKTAESWLVENCTNQNKRL